MSQFIIQGGKPLAGQISVQGAKNAATPCLAAGLLFPGRVVFTNVPNITDVNKMKIILEKIGVKLISDPGKHKVILQAEQAHRVDLDFPEVHQMRSSILLLGPLLARFGRVRIPHPGGCHIGARKIDTHLNAFRALGAKVKKDRKYYYLEAKKLKGTEVVLSEFSVTATENILICACGAQGKTTLKLAAMEPHVQNLARFLKKGGARIKGIGTHTLTIQGPTRFGASTHRIIPDMIEAGTFIIASLVTRGDVVVRDCDPGQLDIFLEKVVKAGARLRLTKNSIRVLPSRNFKPVNIQTLPYPGFPTDLQAPFSVLMMLARGRSLIHDPMYEGRLFYLKELQKMGGRAKILDPHRAYVWGPSKFQGKHIKSFDLRAGATLILAALAARGESIIDRAEEVDRGYENIEQRLSDLGAQIKRVRS